MTLGQNNETARLAGLAYLMVVITGIFSLLYVQGILIDMSDPQQTWQNIVARPFLFRLGAVSSLLCYTFFLILPLMLYQLLRKVNSQVAVLMATLAVASVPISFSSTVHLFDIISLASQAPPSDPVANGLLPSIVAEKLRSYFNGISVAQMFWGLWLFPYGYLVFKSGFLPKLIGAVLMVGSVGYFLDFMGWALLPDYRSMGISDLITLPATIGEIGSCLWLLIMGTNDRKAID